MDDLDLYELLIQDHCREKAARDFLVKMKTAGVAKLLRSAVEVGKAYAKSKKPEIIGGLAGAAIGSGIGGVVVPRWKKGRPSLQEQDAAKIVASQEAEKKQRHAEGKAPKFRHKIQDVAAKGYKGISKAMAEHPVVGSSLYAGLGASTGADFARFLTELSK